MNHLLLCRLGGALIALAALAVPPSTAADPAKDAEDLKALLAAAAKQNPDVLIAEAKAREAEARLAKVRLQVAVKITELHTQRQLKRVEEAVVLGKLALIEKVGVGLEEARHRSEAVTRRQQTAQTQHEATARRLHELKQRMAEIQETSIHPEKEPALLRARDAINATQKLHAQHETALREVAKEAEERRADVALAQQKPELEKVLAKVRADLKRLDIELNGLAGKPLFDKE